MTAPAAGAEEADDGPEPRQVTYEELVAAMRMASGYDVTKTTNSVRFQCETLLRLVRQALVADPARRPLFIGHERWFRAYLAMTGLAEDEAPTYALLAYKYRQDTQIDYRMECVIRRACKGPTPEVAANVKIWWPKEPGTPSSYSYLDIHSVPQVKVTIKREVKLRLLGFGDMMAYDKIKGMHGRPVTGLLGLMFKMIGEGRAAWCKMAVSEDDTLIMRGHARKGPIGISSTITVHPDGRAVKGLPPDREDLVPIETRLEKALKIKYAAF